MQRFVKNRNLFPPEELEKYAGKYVAWNPDGTGIIASADSLADLAAAVERTEFNPEECVLSSVPYPDEIVLGADRQVVLVPNASFPGIVRR